MSARQFPFLIFVIITGERAFMSSETRRYACLLQSTKLLAAVAHEVAITVHFAEAPSDLLMAVARMSESVMLPSPLDDVTGNMLIAAERSYPRALVLKAAKTPWLQ